jgi:hypothetical protein
MTRRKQGYKFDDLKREIFVVLEIEYCRDEHLPNDNGQWLEYLQILEEGNLVGAKAKFGKEGDIHVLLDAGDDHGNSASPRPHASVGGTGDAQASRDNSLAPPGARGIGSTDAGLQPFCRRSEVYHKYLPYSQGVEKVAEYLSNVKKNEAGKLRLI